MDTKKPFYNPPCQLFTILSWCHSSLEEVQCKFYSLFCLHGSGDRARELRVRFLATQSHDRGKKKTLILILGQSEHRVQRGRSLGHSNQRFGAIIDLDPAIILLRLFNRWLRIINGDIRERKNMIIIIIIRTFHGTVSARGTKKTRIIFSH